MRPLLKMANCAIDDIQNKIVKSYFQKKEK